MPLRVNVLAFFVFLTVSRFFNPVSSEDWDVMPQGDIAGPVVKHTQPVEETNQTPAAESPAVDDKPKKTIAQIIDEALEQEFPKDNEADIGKNFNETSKKDEATMETVVKVSSKQKPEDKNATQAEGVVQADGGGGNGTVKAKLKTDAPVEKEVDRLIDKEDNEYVLSMPKKGSGLGLTLDPQLIRDLTILISSSSVVGLGMEALKQPVINGYFIAGSLVGPGGVKWVKELVQVQSLAQLGVSLLLFTLGLEFSLAKLRAVRGVALVGGVLEILVMSLLGGGLAIVIGGRLMEGIFTGLLVAMSSTSIVVKCLADAKSTNSPLGQITVGTLILQDCMVGLIFAFMPLLGQAGALDGTDVAIVVLRVTLKLVATVGVCILLARVLLSPAVRLLATQASHELFQLALLAFCLTCAMVTGYLGLSSEVGAFLAGVMVATTEQQESALHTIESVKQMFVTLFIASTGLMLSPLFLLQHLPVLTAGLLLVLVTKTLLFSGVVWLFGYSLGTCVAVGLSMAQIGEFAFVLLSLGSDMQLVQPQLSMLLMGVTALSLLVTPSLMQLGRSLLNEGTDALPYTRVKARKSSSATLGDVEVDSLVAVVKLGSGLIAAQTVPCRESPPPPRHSPPACTRHEQQLSSGSVNGDFAGVSASGLLQRSNGS